MYKTNYSVAVNWLNNNFILCNGIQSIDLELFDDIVGELEEDDEVFQYYLTDCSRSDANWLAENFPGLVFGYSPMLDLYVLMVTHFGTSWKYVSMDTLLENAARELGEDK